MDRILFSHKILVATTPTSYDRFVSSNGNGVYSGFEIELIRYIAAQLGLELHSSVPLAVSTVEIPWSGLFTAMQQGEADIAIRSITRTKSREQEYPNLDFTSGYLTNHQIFITMLPNGNFPDSLRGAKVGVKQNSFNERAARFLAEQYQFTTDASYVAYGDLYQALRDGKIAYALVDSVLASEFLRNQGAQLGPALDAQLRSFYDKELGQDHEEYSIVIRREGAKDRLRDAIQNIMGSAAFGKFLEGLKIKYGLH
jgi:ABC-type amino acid transport substrate-binding protein